MWWGHRLKIKVGSVKIIDASYIICLVIKSVSAVITSGSALSMKIMLLKYSI